MGDLLLGLPTYLAANKGIAPTGNAVVGLSMSGGSALTHWRSGTPPSSSSRPRCRASLNPSIGLWPTLIGVAMKDAGGYRAFDM